MCIKMKWNRIFQICYLDLTKLYVFLPSAGRPTITYPACSFWDNYFSLTMIDDANYTQTFFRLVIFKAKLLDIAFNSGSEGSITPFKLK